MSTDENYRRINDLLAEMRSGQGLSSVEGLIAQDSDDTVESLDAARELLHDWSLPADKRALLEELVKALEQRLARTAKGLQARASKMHRMTAIIK
jgi:hypothetical protein